MGNAVERPRKRAWFFLQVDDSANPESIAEEIYNTYKDQPEGDLDRFVLIRAGTISGFKRFKIIVPVDAIHPEGEPEESVLDEVEELLMGMDGVIEVKRVVMESHFPELPHDTQAYITQQEFDQGRDLIIDVTHSGRQYPRSPGSNKWG